MAPMDPIEISSSDSETENIVEREPSLPMGYAASATSRMLPSWASSSISNTKSYGGPSQNDSFPKRAPSTYEMSNSHQCSSNERKTDDMLTAITNAPTHSVHNAKDVQPHVDVIADSRNYEASGTESGKLSSQQNLKRTLPPSLQPSAMTSEPRTYMENGNRRHILDTHHRSYNYGSSSQTYVENGTSSKIPDTSGRTLNSGGANLIGHKVYIKDESGRGNDDDVIMYSNSGVRHLPSSMLPVKSVNGSQYTSSGDPAYLSAAGEERATESDERLIFQAAVQDLSQPRVEAALPDGLMTVSLLRHQKIALAWMLQKETTSLHCLGGILADDQGLGKTISMIALIQMQRSLQTKSSADHLQKLKAEALNLDDDDIGVSELEKVKQIGVHDDLEMVPEVKTCVQAFCKGRPAAGTLVVCPASVLRQWARELDEKVPEGAKLSVLIYHGSTRTKDPVELAKYDVVLTTYSIVTNEVPKQPLVDDDDGDQRNGEKYGLNSEFSVNKKRKKTANVGKKGKKGRKGIDGSSIDSDSGTLARVGWFRVILDEAQTIKNHRTQVARACCGLRAKRRWCLSGTPIQNAIDDLYSYFRFLKYDPYAVYKSFCSTIKHPISRNAFNGYKKLQAVLKTIMLRRTKATLIDGEPVIKLPPKSICLAKVDFSSEERAFYSRLEADSRSQFKAYAAAGTVNQNYANILLMLLRLRQACDHPYLVKGYNSDSVGKASLEIARRLPKDMLLNLLKLLEASLAICVVCSDPPEDAVVTMCGHVFCYQCVSEYLTGDENVCPASECREQLGADVVFSRATLKSCISNEPDSSATCSDAGEKSIVMQSVYTSSKIKAAVNILQTQCKMNLSSELSSEKCVDLSVTSEATCSEHCQSVVNSAPHTAMTSRIQAERGGPRKTIVFSQWTSMLDLLESALNQHFIQYRRFDGTMSLTSRDKSVTDFNCDPEVTVMLMSLKAGNLGLNMVAACHVILLDLWWNPTTEDQAVDRAHRIGQTRPVTVSRITVKDTVEDRILALQEEKRKMVASAFGEDQSGGSATRLTVDDLRYLFMV